ncbi:hypothetical protein CcaverHIS002_0212570 [Cutaneotrichosporon cavernicola]|uniref:tRNA pseudouridine(55) synthase n=1 Tax=Cutaneotrichosporon cavernicola TaxID=279322 RepID=A0AA48IA37_9TREE|nr:uncharacterized protein CcaverHIS019_0212570 [Cutaneotrichosporon cavernicola]BEI82097.1 hypothetical protein CcaverHIS002_0212570 [Cutaneotrichosporon cavernicola]BEI89895.1 hypothetical protein CcaverHIS019_0212570 [Cutaneotrichosporon cavernicola]BEI97666.1 hypothetical protein CcaverHIS631_0212550 [Cutaneotrichosporon cavernicola]BEJ05443.1 hypothetical protein CcaverHIS641_0212600 [Cutaneotrichosporon cavernicola]
MAAGSSLPLNGLFPIAKPSGPGSMRVIEAMTPLLIESRLFTDPNLPAGGREVERNKRKRNKTHMGLKIGQGGTLDPLADGVLVIGVGRGTKHLNRFLECSKEYVSIGLLGAATTSYDSQDPVISTGNFDSITREDVEKALEQFRGKIKQTPPIFSALKMDGKPLHEYARENKPLPRPIPVRECQVEIDLIDFTPAQVVEGDGGHTYRWPEARLDEGEKDTFRRLTQIVHDANEAAKETPAEPEIDLNAPDFPEVSAQTGLRPASFTVRMTVSSGTYVRSIVHDIGLALGCGAHVVKLTRTRQGEFVLSEDDVKRVDEQEGRVKVEASEEEAMNNTAEEDEMNALNAAAASAPSHAAADKMTHQRGPTTACIPWALFENAIAERDAAIKAGQAEIEELKESGAPFKDIKEALREQKKAREREELADWEKAVMERFHSVPIPVVRDSKTRAEGVYFRR